MSSYLPFHNLAYCPKQIIEFVQRPEIQINDLNKMIENLKLPKSHDKIIKQMKVLVEKQESFFNDGNTNIRTCDEEDSVSPKRIFGKLSY